MEVLKIRNVAIIGTGQIGFVVSWLCAANGGLGTYLYDIVPENMQRTMNRLKESFQERLDLENATIAFSRLHPCKDLKEALNNVDLAFENVPEVMEVKQKMHAEIGSLAPPHVLMGSNTSSMICSPLAEASGRPEKFFNMNFSVIDPQREALAELMGNPKTTEATMQAARNWAKSIGVVPVVTKEEIMGYAVNRIWRAIKKESLFLVDQGYSDPESIDRGFMLLFGTPYGPFGIMDAAGLDTIEHIEWRYYENSRDESDKPPKVLRDLVKAGHLGEKTGRGFYSYPNPNYKHPGWLTMDPPWEEDEKGN
ncbi:MAG TPA: 3-hydroxyacyl-CoA dehydrogenase NAD-binding domain-containing protein [Desulfosporosinus sp.]|nr:3-hydroxyacyl-CoA dehydrogenase NAD-binding domain-containing protein [Desulfosporosinus sp.]